MQGFRIQEYGGLFRRSKQTVFPMFRRFAALIGFFLILASSSGASRPSINQRIREQQQKVEYARLRLQQKRGQLGIAKARVADFQHQLAETDKAIGEVNLRLGGLSGQIRQVQKRLAWNAIQLNAAQASLRLHDETYKRRLVDIYEHGDLGYLDVILGAKSYSDFVERWDDMRLIIAANQRAIRARLEAKRRVEAIQHTLQANKNVIEGLVQQQNQSKNQLNALASERQQLVVVADAQRRNLATEVTQLEEVTAGQAAALQSLVVERQREYEAQIAAERAAAAAEAKRRRDAAIARGEIPPTETLGPRADNTYALSWPVRGPITSPFGYRYHPIRHRTIFHEGMDIGADSGTPILAPADGRIIVAGWVSGYGNYIGIAHGGGVTTGYGHCSQTFVSVGQDVKRGQAIGAVGSTGNSTGPHLHFEVRVDGSPVDPATRLR